MSIHIHVRGGGADRFMGRSGGLGAVAAQLFLGGAEEGVGFVAWGLVGVHALGFIGPTAVDCVIIRMESARFTYSSDIHVEHHVEV